jgi:Holliday junction resolvasome RuvABC DNA-binding subunit
VLKSNQHKKFKIIALKDMVDESEIDKSALETLTSLGYEKDIAMIAIKRVGTAFGALGYDGLNKAIDMC